MVIKIKEAIFILFLNSDILYLLKSFILFKQTDKHFHYCVTAFP